ncbi:DUF397 domain-containing protein [Streptomyces sp. DT2A-34]|uniref:DUF397 domain-containing protein n=1 Tax=Streptomyces sp. DT2A-34 TaxID=3051182 RepID=UPI00265C5A41|nr:DUF397 domain-containing protein [Streptomyces sp. DT2A-34]MDO0913653.1 DUF397 domain-containing protein [Streptomyces sp. DT2A-34]
MPELTWQRSTYSAEAANCVEIASTPTTMHIRDSKNPTGSHLTFRPTAWAGFLSHAMTAKR